VRGSRPKNGESHPLLKNPDLNLVVHTPTADKEKPGFLSPAEKKNSMIYIVHALGKDAMQKCGQGSYERKQGTRRIKARKRLP